MNLIRSAAASVFAISVAACLLPSCNNFENEVLVEVNAVSDTEAPVLHATIEGSEASDTKVYTDAALHVLWNKDDLITAFVQSTRNKKYHFEGNDGANGGDFVWLDDGSLGTGEHLDYIYAVYPYDKNISYVLADGASILSDFIRAYLPEQQSYKANSFGRGANLMVAKSSTTDLSFKNVGGFLCFKIYGATESLSIRSIILEGRNNEYLSGPVKISLGEGNVPTMVFDTEHPEELGKRIVLTAEEPVVLGTSSETAATFWMVVPPVTFTNGIKITIIDGNGGIITKSTSNSIAITRNTRKTMAAFSIQAVDVPTPAEGIYPFGGPAYAKEVADQYNIYEYGGNAWVRLLVLSTLKMYELGPIPLTASAKDRLPDVTFTTYVEGVATSSVTSGCVVRAYSGGVMDVVSDLGDRYVFRF